MRNVTSLIGLAAILLFGATTAAAQTNRPQGPQGPAAAPKTSGGAHLGSAQLYAVVDEAGILAAAQSKGTLPCEEPSGTCRHPSPGGFEVRFARDITACAYTATLGGPGLNPSPPGEISVSWRDADPTAVFVYTRESDGTPNWIGFQLHVLC